MTDNLAEARGGLRVVAYTTLAPAYSMIAAWARRHGHRLLLLITTPGPSTRRTQSYRDLIATAPPEQEILVSTRTRRPAPLIAALKPDLVVSLSFPYRIPPEVTSIPRFGAVNLHPAPLPAYRGPNPARMFYDGAPVLGATLHRTAADFDTGAILSRHERPMPAEITQENVFPLWVECMQQAFEEGTQRAVAGEPGTPQDHAQATYAAAFTEEEHWLDWALPAKVLQRRATALNLFSPTARASIDGSPYVVSRFSPITGPAAPDSARPGTVVERAGGALIIAAFDGLVRVDATPA